MEVSDQIIGVLDALCEKFGVVVDWSSKNVVSYLQDLFSRYITYEILTSIVWCLIPILLALVALVGFKKSYEDYQKSDSDDGNLCCICILALVAVAVIGTIVIVCQIFDIITCLTFPEKMFIEELKPLIAH